MFTSLYAAKKSGLIAFDWLETCVIIYSTDERGRLGFYGMADGTVSDSSARSIFELNVACELGIVKRKGAQTRGDS